MDHNYLFSQKIPILDQKLLYSLFQDLQKHDDKLYQILFDLRLLSFLLLVTGLDHPTRFKTSWSIHSNSFTRIPLFNSIHLRTCWRHLTNSINYFNSQKITNVFLNIQGLLSKGQPMFSF